MQSCETHMKLIVNVNHMQQSNDDTTTLKPFKQVNTD